MGLYVFYDINNGYLINNLDKESKKKSDRGKNMKVKNRDFLKNLNKSFHQRMNGLLLNEHRMFNECAKQYATKHLSRDYEAMKPSINQFMQVISNSS